MAIFYIPLIVNYCTIHNDLIKVINTNYNHEEIMDINYKSLKSNNFNTNYENQNYILVRVSP